MSTTKKMQNMSDILKLQRQVAKVAEDNKKKVAELNAKFEKVEREAYDECPVCYGSISVKNTCCMPNCDHKMCKDCYYNWLDKQEKNTCPMCRAEVFKNNNDIKEKRETLQHQVNDLEGSVSILLSERKNLRKSIIQADKSRIELVDTARWLEDKCDQLEDEIFDKKQIVDEITEYKRRPWNWKNKMETRQKKNIKKGYLTWRNKMNKLKKELLVEYEFRCHCNNYKEEGYQKELNRIYSITYAKHMINVDLSEIEIDLSETNMFNEPEQKGLKNMRLNREDRRGERDPRSDHRYKFEEALHYIQNIEVKYKSAYNYGHWRLEEEYGGYDTDETTSMPELIGVSDSELETTFSEDELEYDRAALNVASPLEEGEIIEIPSIRRQLNFDQHTYTMIPEFNESVLLYGSTWLETGEYHFAPSSSASV